MIVSPFFESYLELAGGSRFTWNALLVLACVGYILQLTIVLYYFYHSVL
jgi:hypothetical protein